MIDKLKLPDIDKYAILLFYDFDLPFEKLQCFFRHSDFLAKSRIIKTRLPHFSRQNDTRALFGPIYGLSHQEQRFLRGDDSIVYIAVIIIHIRGYH